MRLLPLLILVSACASSSAREADLSRELADRTAGPPVQCVDDSGPNLSARDSRTLVYEKVDVILVNRLDAACPGLRPSSMLIFEPVDGSRFCEGDRFRVAEEPGRIEGPYCRLGPFTPYHR